jgi:hypothetical protein
MMRTSALKKLYKSYHDFYNRYYLMDREVSSFRYPIEQIIRTEKNIQSKESVILEYGCGSGFNLEYLRNIGYSNLFGIEQNLEIYSNSDVDENIRIINGNLSNGDQLIEGIKFDFIFTRAVLQQKIGIGKIYGDFNTDLEVIKILSIFSCMLKENGIVFLNEGTLTRDWSNIIKNSGFELIDSGENFFKLKIK